MSTFAVWIPAIILGSFIFIGYRVMWRREDNIEMLERCYRKSRDLENAK